LSEINEIIEKY